MIMVIRIDGSYYKTASWAKLNILRWRSKRNEGKGNRHKKNNAAHMAIKDRCAEEHGKTGFSGTDRSVWYGFHKNSRKKKRWEVAKEAMRWR